MEQKENRIEPPEGRGIIGTIAIILAGIILTLLIIWL